MSQEADIAAAKRVARAEAVQRRDAARAADRDLGAQTAANMRLLELLDPFRGRAISGYMAIRSELSPLRAMEDWAGDGPVCLPVVTEKHAPLSFRRWQPGCAMETGAYGAAVPALVTLCAPVLLIVPLLAFDRFGGRLGYGGGYYDRTLAQLRAKTPTLAIGLAYAAQESPVALAREATDAMLDAIVTESETRLTDGRQMALAPRHARP